MGPFRHLGSTWRGTANLADKACPFRAHMPALQVATCPSPPSIIVAWPCRPASFLNGLSEVSYLTGKFQRPQSIDTTVYAGSSQYVGHSVKRSRTGRAGQTGTVKQIANLNMNSRGSQKLSEWRPFRKFAGQPIRRGMTAIGAKLAASIKGERLESASGTSASPRAGPCNLSRSDTAPWFEFPSDLAARAVGVGRNLALAVLSFGMER